MTGSERCARFSRSNAHPEFMSERMPIKTFAIARLKAQHHEIRATVFNRGSLIRPLSCVIASGHQEGLTRPHRIASGVAGVCSSIRNSMDHDTSLGEHQMGAQKIP